MLPVEAGRSRELGEVVHQAHQEPPWLEHRAARSVQGPTREVAQKPPSGTGSAGPGTLPCCLLNMNCHRNWK
ncbi:hypothetical protein ART_1184 [Arthrobacter sp. PAMC 25486]|nr:hypothetical protein ART_1184 [Arthrobacter sp. PAMC 25486]